MNALAVLLDGHLASARRDHTVRLWDPRTGDVQTIINHEGWVNALAVLPDGRLASAGGDQTVGLWDPDPGGAHYAKPDDTSCSASPSTVHRAGVSPHRTRPHPRGQFVDVSKCSRWPSAISAFTSRAGS